MKKENVINVAPIVIHTATIKIVGDSDLILNKMDYYQEAKLVAIQTNQPVPTDPPVPWRIIISKLNWRDGEPTDYTEEGFKKALVENAPCIHAYGLKNSWGEAVTRNGIEQYSTRFKANVNILAKGNLIPIEFTENYIDEKLIAPRKGKPPVYTQLNRFTGWSAEVTIQYLNEYSLDQIVQIINLAGFSMGIGSGRSSGYGRYHIEGVTK